MFMKDINIEQFIATSDFKLKNVSTKIALEADEDKLEDELKKLSKKLGEWQDVLYAHSKYAVLICLQGMDTAGKDSLIREVFNQFNTRGVVVHSFKVPTNLELRHDFLWRHYIALPARGKFGIFNRTHYENVLVTRVHPEYVLGENLPNVNSLEDIDENFWDSRFEQIRNFEDHLSKNGTIIFKFFLNISKEEQRQRLLRRLNRSDKNWKFSPGDLKERQLWDDYMDCYEEAIQRTSTPNAPWYVIPSDNKDAARYIVAKVLWEELSKYTDVQEPELEAKILENLEDYKKQLQHPDA
ncbi:polyphosphate:nucleotide phosphotransferase, PPK2 family [Gillisia sp. Hel1_33_143]|nr:polyphosphate:nucleotide phosphotransferase, PPK2 family [Gillisia sp. Hel1_33_143]